MILTQCTNFSYFTLSLSCFYPQNTFTSISTRLASSHTMRPDIFFHLSALTNRFLNIHKTARDLWTRERVRELPCEWNVIHCMSMRPINWFLIVIYDLATKNVIYFATHNLSFKNSFDSVEQMSWQLMFKPEKEKKK